MKLCKKYLPSLLTWILFIGASILAVSNTPKTPPKKSTDLVFVQLWIPREKLEAMKRECKSSREATIEYSDGYYAIIPCPMVGK